MKQLLFPTNATFSATGKTITFATTIPASISHILHVTNVTRGVIYFQPQAGANFSGSFTSPTLTLNCSTTGHADTDKLEIFYDDTISQATESTLAGQNALFGPLTETAPTTDTASSGQNGRLQRISQRITALIAQFPAALGIQPVAGSLSTAPASGATWPVSAATLPLPAGAASSANQTTANTSLASVATNTANIPTPVAGRTPVDGSGVTQPVSGTVGVSGVVTTTQSTVTSGAVNAAVPTNAALLGGSDGTNLRAVKVSPTGVLSVDGSGVTQPVTMFNANGGQSIAATTNGAWISVDGYGGFGMRFGGTWTGTVIVEGSVRGNISDGAISLAPLGGGLRLSSISTVGSYEGIAAGLQSIRVNCSAVVSGTVTVDYVTTDDSRIVRVWSTNPGNFFTSIFDSTGSSITVGQKTSAASLPVVLASDAAFPLASGAATSAKQPALGTAGTASADVISMQGIAGGVVLPVSGNLGANVRDGAGTAITSSTINGKQRLDVTLAAGGTPGSAIPLTADMIGGSDGTNLRALKVTTNGTVVVDGSAVTQPVSSASLTSIDSKIQTLGVKTMALSAPVVISSDQAAIDVTFPQVVAFAVSNRLSTAGTVQAQIEPGGTYTFALSQEMTLGVTANTLASSTTTVGSTVVAYTGTSPLVGQYVAGTGIAIGAYVVSVSAAVSYTTSLPATATGTVTVNVTAGSFAGNFQSSPDGTSWSNVSVFPQTFTSISAPTNNAAMAGLFRYHATALEKFLRFNLTAITLTGVQGNLTSHVLRVDIDAFDRLGSIVNLPYISYVAATAATFPAGIPFIMPIDTNCVSEVAIGLAAFAGTSQSLAWRQTNDPLNGTNDTISNSTTQSATNTIAINTTVPGSFRIAPSQRYLFVNYSGGSAVTAATVSGVIARIGAQPSMPSVTLSTNNVATNISQIGGQAPITASANGSPSKALGIIVGTAVPNTDQSATAFAGSGRVNGTTVISNTGGGVSAAFDLNITVTTLGTATALVPVLAVSLDSGTTFTDVWTATPITTSQHIRVPAIPIEGRRRWSLMSVGGTSTTVPATITAQELPGVNVLQRQFVDIFAATNPTASVINGVTTASTLVSTTAGSTSGVALVEGCKLITVTGVFTGGTPTVAPIYTLQISDDTINWFTVTGTMITPTAAGTFKATAVNMCARYARLNVTTASTGGIPYGVTYTSIYGIN